ncbi:superoxide dismutase family protein [Aurantiacibacter sp. MUD11]|uniref:superoxide dismutase family protein n=1 Tax=Aurantiacibacter sp. MUD11 TaxID=3003265 RepID=UPI0022AA2BFA|nr:superoxide dismutase family protein [Aurantiacibacter sp. MUD11]WAT17326.1 superoxide dismutase family protein [Aurantiacibacter sp. MUD11]
MSMHKIAIFSTLMLATAGCATVYESAAEEVGVATIADRNGQAVGTARLYSLAGEVTISASFEGLPAGDHAVHLHTTGDCSAADFTSAGGHLNPGGNEHGTRNPRGAHLGDLPNATIAADGVGTLSAILRGTSSTIIPQIFDADGTAIVVHEGADDYRSDPAGAAGSRIACGVFSRL